MKRLTVRRGHEKRILAGHTWVFSNEVEESLGSLEPGELVLVKTSSGEVLGTAAVSPHSLILGRLIPGAPTALDEPFFRARIGEAIERRARYLPGASSYRLVYGEGDGLPGLVVDRYGDQIVFQTHTSGMDLRRDLITSALVALLAPRAIVERNDHAGRALEGLPERALVVHGETDGSAIVEEDGLLFRVDILRGQKTGFFFDQRSNRRLVAGWAAGRRVLDLFTYVGAWALCAARAGAREVAGVDSSAAALAIARENAERNGLAQTTRWEQGDAETAAATLAARGERFDLVVVDPPAYVKSRKKLFAGLRKYRAMNEKAIRLVAPRGLLVTCSCSYHVRPEMLLELSAEAARRAGRTASVIARGGLPPDHPVPPGVPEADYLKCYVMEIT